MQAGDLYDVSVIGLGKLGLPMAVCFAAKGLRVLGVDRNPGVLRQLETGELATSEPDVSELFAAHRSNLHGCASVEIAIARSRTAFIMVATPSDEQDRFALDQALDVCRSIGHALRTAQGYRLLVLSSTVMPGDTDKLKTTLEQSSGRRCGPDFGLCYSPELFALGSIVQNLYRPDLILAGECDPEAGEHLTAFYQQICDNMPPVVRMSFVNAELAKLAINTYISTKITLANTLASLCERLPDGDVDVVTAAMGFDERIGPKYLKGGLGFGGPCFPRDQSALVALSRQLGVSSSVAEAVSSWNNDWAAQLQQRVLAQRPAGGRIGVLGLAFKPGSDLLAGSGGFELARSLSAAGERVVVHDPLAMPAARMVLGDAVTYASSALGCLREVDVAVITTPWPEYRQLQMELAQSERSLAVIDCWRLLDRTRVGPKVSYFAIGIGPERPLAEPGGRVIRSAASRV